MTPCFADTSYFLALLIPDDNHHEAARGLASRLRRPIVTSEFVVLEVGNFLSATRARKKYADFLRVLRADPETTVVSLSPALLQRAIDLYLARPDKTWSVTDCSSFEIMRENAISDALTADRHFQQAGFLALLKTVT